MVSTCVQRLPSMLYDIAAVWLFQGFKQEARAAQSQVVSHLLTDSLRSLLCALLRLANHVFSCVSGMA